MSLERFWPTDAQRTAVLTTDAESASEAVVLAVHQPVVFRKRRVGQQDAVDAHEANLLETFLAGTADGRVIIPIIGASGSGKSHVIRWLDAQLRARDDKNNFLIVRIRKGRSLRGVIEDILGLVKGDQYEPFREKLHQARDRIDPDKAADFLCQMLAHAVQDLCKRASTMRLEGKETEESKLWIVFGQNDALPTLLVNQRLRDLHFVRTTAKPGIVRRLIAQFYEERVGKLEDDREHVFREQDLDFTDILSDHLDDLGRPEVKAIQKLSEPARRAAAVRVLNAALDTAKQDLLGLSPTIADLFLALRRELFADQRQELVLLIEDFAVLSGLQGQLLQVIIQEAFRDGKQEMCTIRAAIAYTPGYMQTDTVLTRAQFEFAIPEEDESEEAIHTRIRELVAAYLNAARVGQDRLDQRCRAAKNRLSRDEWVPVVGADDEDVRALLDHFGYEHGVPLFPFNSASIRALASQECRKNKTLVFNPRLVIQNVLDAVLLLRDDFIGGSFPPASLRKPSTFVDASVAQLIGSRAPKKDQPRFLSLAAYWGADARAAEEFGPAIGGIASVFQLPATFSSASSSPKGQQTPVGEKKRIETAENGTTAPELPVREALRAPPPPVQAPSRVPEPEVRKKWRATLERWRQPGTEVSLAPREATSVKKLCETALDEAIEWDWLAFKLPYARPEFETVFLPGGKSNPEASKASILVATAEDRIDPIRGARIASELLALGVQHDEDDRVVGWDYEGADDDLIHYSSFVERNAPRWRAYHFDRPLGPEWSPLLFCFSVLAAGARVLQVPGGSSRDMAKAVNALFATVDVPAVPEQRASWPAQRHALAAARADEATTTRELALQLVGARQGGGPGVHAIDIARVARVLRSLDDSKLDLTQPDFNNRQMRDPLIAGVVATRGVLLRFDDALAAERQRIEQWRVLVTSSFGDTFDKIDVAAKLRERIDKLHNLLKVPTDEARQVRTLIDNFQKSALTDALHAAVRLAENDVSRSEALTLIGADHSAAHGAATAVVAALSSLTSELDRELKRVAIAVGDPLADARAGLLHAAERLRATVESFQ